MVFCNCRGFPPCFLFGISNAGRLDSIAAEYSFVFWADLTAGRDSRGLPCPCLFPAEILSRSGPFSPTSTKVTFFSPPKSKMTPGCSLELA